VPALMKAVWPETFVEEADLTRNTFLLGTALGERQPATYCRIPPGRIVAMSDKCSEMANGGIFR
jgi:hypothetical protein